jgi:hypothetical protein
VARAKRTDRADARRRYRQYQSADLEDVEGAELDDAAAPAPTRGSRPAPAPPQRPGITASFRNAYRRANYREDIAALPSLLKTRAFLLPLGLVAAGTIAVAIAPRTDVGLLLFTLLVFDPRTGSPGFGPLMLVGFFATRASYLLGLLIGLVDFAAGIWFAFAIAPLILEKPTDVAAVQAALPSTLPSAVLFGVLFSSGAAWYRRFLTLSNRRGVQQAKARQQQRTRAGKPAKS